MIANALPDGVLLNVGSGPVVVDDWISVDGSWQARLAAHPLLARAARVVTGREVGHWPHGIVCRDVRQGLGFAAHSAAAIYSSHFIEHLQRDEARRFLEACRMALKPGGVCRVVTPDLRALAARYLSSTNGGGAEEFMRASLLSEPASDATSGPLAWYRRRTRFETHKWLYDAASLKQLFEEAGFRGAEEKSFLESRIPSELLGRVEVRDRIANGAGIVVEATA